MWRSASFLATIGFCVLLGPLAHADTTAFFEPCQVYTLVSTEVTSETISSNGYLFTYTRDNLFTGGTGEPIGRPVRVPWPEGIEAQAVTTPPAGVTDYKARMTISRVDGEVFDIPAFTFKLLANTAGAGASLEIMPLQDGEDAFPDPLFFNATGYYGQTFSYDTSPNPWGSTALLVGFDTYKVALYVDFAFVALTFDSAAPGLQSCCVADSCADVPAASCAALGGTSLGPGTSCACDPCSAPAGPPPVPDGRLATAPLLVSRLDTIGETLQVDWDAYSCTATDYNLIYGALSDVSGYLLAGALCSLGTGGSQVWTSVPAGDLFLLMVGTDGGGTESSWGLDGADQERNGLLPSGTCGVTLKDTSGTCPP